KEIEEILNQQIKAALREHNRPRLGLFLSAFAAGLEVGFSVFLISTMHNLLVDQVSAAVLQIVLALSYPIGFIFVVIGRSELFTEHTTLAILPVLTGSTTKRRLLVLWSTIFVGNLVGGYLFSAILINLSPNLGIASEETFVALAHHAIRHESGVILLSAIVAGWLMGLLAWLVTASTETISRIVIIVLVTSLIGIGGLHHSIVGSIEVFTGMVTSPSIHFSDYLNFQLWTTLGNLIGGVFFVALIKYGHTRRIR
ncbi:MAG: formate/nitrite transporter family protein, partial [Bacteroidia bacterium]|nr:formate/nitrite transporter family protein [Bacteroidia bacterium]